MFPAWEEACAGCEEGLPLSGRLLPPDVKVEGPRRLGKGEVERGGVERGSGRQELLPSSRSQGGRTWSGAPCISFMPPSASGVLGDA